MPSDKFFSPQEKEAASTITPLVSSPEDIVKPAGPIKRKLDLNSSDEFESNNNKHLKTHQNNGVEIAEKQNGSDVAAAVDGEKQFNGTSQELQMDAAEKERRFNNFRRLYPEMDSLLAQQLLTRNKWDVSKANKAVKNTSSNRIYESIEEYEKKQKSSLLKEKAELEQNIKHSHRSTSHHSSSSSTSKHRSPHKHSSSSHKSSSTSTKSSSSSHSPSKSSSHKSSHHHHKRRSDEKDNHHRRSGEKEKDREKRKSDEHHHKSSSSKPKNDKKNKHNEDSDEDQDRHNTAVYDSDADSDDGTNFVMTKDRQTVFDFFNQATHTELMSVKTCSAKKADIIIELRPFESWSGLVTKINEHKSLNYDLLNNGHEWLKRREKVTKLLRKCNKIIVSLQRAIEGCKDKQIEQPRLLCTDLKLADYQLIGLNWLIMMHQEGFNGILADEMGLGKTIQIISFLAYLKEKDLSNGPHLIIVPSSTLDNWDNEMAKWCPTLNVVKYYGSLDDRKSLRISFSRGGLDGVDVVLTTYTTVASQPEERKMFRTIKIDYVIFDEAHMLKNMTTIRYEHLSKINANRRILLTGTPLQNNLLELMSLLCFIMPKLFSSSTEDFKTLFQKAYKPSKGAEEEGGTKSETATFFEQSQIEKAKQVMKPFVLRRLKKDVLKCLPPKSTTVIRVKMAEDQRRNYNNLVEYYSNEDNVVKSSSENNGMSIMMDMRKLTNHPLLMRYFFTDKKCNEISQRLATDMIYKKTNAEYILEELVTMSDYQIYQLAQKYPSTKHYKIPDKLILDCGKFKELNTLLPKLKKEGHRVLIFSQFTMMLDVLERYLGIQKFGYLRLDGNTTVTERQDMIDDFNSDHSKYFVFLLSTRAGGLGINLTTADTVIMYDIDFNPYNDKQAEDRCHRLGQTKPVHIYKLITDQSIEEGMYAVAQEKLNLERDVTNQADENTQEDHKCMVKLLTTALGFDKNKAENLLSPTAEKKKPKT